MAQEVQISLETFRAETERRRRAFEVATQETEPLEHAIDAAWHDIQELKDIITIVISPHSYDANATAQASRAAFTRLASAYREWGSQLPDKARRAWHSAKNAGAALVTALEDENALQMPGARES
jgi:hypothetical protein